MEALLFFSYYIASKGIEKSISIFSDSKQVTVEMDRWNPVTVVKLMSKMQKTINDKLRKQFGEEDEVKKVGRGKAVFILRNARSSARSITMRWTPWWTRWSDSVKVR